MKINEILLLHHSHLDVGYTHTQPIVWQLQFEFIEQALELLEKTKDWDELSKPRWTCEVTVQVIKWLEFASEESIEKFRQFVAEERIGISGFEYNTTPNCNAEQLTLQLKNIKLLKEKFGVEIKAVNQHDVNGIPWSASDIMLDAGIELFIMATNNHFGGYTYKRPSLFRWETPSKRELLVMNGAHYTMFDQLLDTHENTLESMELGYNNYLKHLEKIDYDLDFIYLTTANAPVCYDNAPPNIDVAKLVREWNEKGKQPKIRYVTTNMLLERIKKIEREKIVKLSGDWTDYWNFGAASTAYETKVNQNTKSLLNCAEMISTVAEPNKFRKKEILESARGNINLYDEHTWGAFNSTEYDKDFVRYQDCMKKNPAIEGRELIEYYLINELENLSDNPESNYEQEGVLVVNSSPVRKNEYIRIPDWWKLDGKRLRTARFGWPNRYQQIEEAPFYGPVEIEPFSWKQIPFDNLLKAEANEVVTSGDKIEKSEVKRLNRDESQSEETGYSFIESPFHRLEYDKKNGRILSLFDKINNWEVIDNSSEYTFFQFVREQPDPLFGNDRSDMYARNLEAEKFDANCWVTDWKAKYETAERLLDIKVETGFGSKTLCLKFAVPGAKFLEQRITFKADSPVIDLELSLLKEDVQTPESVYFVFPLNINEGWQGAFDTAGVSVKLDEEQLPRSSRGWQTVENFAAMYDDQKGAALFCPDAPMVQMGDFNFGRKFLEMERNKNPKLLAWPLNNYWDTNFSASQPGLINIKYAFTTFTKFNKKNIRDLSRGFASKLETHPQMNCASEMKNFFVKSDCSDLEILNLKLSDNHEDVILRVIKSVNGDGTSEIEFPQLVKAAWVVDTLENKKEAVEVDGAKIKVNLKGNLITQIYLQF